MTVPVKKSVGAHELKTRFGRYLRAVRSGATLLITERGEPVAELRPLPTGRGAGLDRQLDEMASCGLLTRASGERLAPFRPVRVPEAPVATTVVEDREDRF